MDNPPEKPARIVRQSSANYFSIWEMLSGLLSDLLPWLLGDLRPGGLINASRRVVRAGHWFKAHRKTSVAVIVLVVFCVLLYANRGVVPAPAPTAPSTAPTAVTH